VQSERRALVCFKQTLLRCFGGLLPGPAALPDRRSHVCGVVSRGRMVLPALEAFTALLIMMMRSSCCRFYDSGDGPQCTPGLWVQDPIPERAVRAAQPLCRAPACQATADAYGTMPSLALSQAGARARAKGLKPFMNITMPDQASCMWSMPLLQPLHHCASAGAESVSTAATPSAWLVEAQWALVAVELPGQGCRTL